MQVDTLTARGRQGIMRLAARGGRGYEKGGGSLLPWHMDQLVRPMENYGDCHNTGVISDYA